MAIAIFEIAQLVTAIYWMIWFLNHTVEFPDCIEKWWLRSKRSKRIMIFIIALWSVPSAWVIGGAVCATDIAYGLSKAIVSGRRKSDADG